MMKLQLCLARSIHARHMLEIIVLGGALQASERFNRKEVERSFISTCCVSDSLQPQVHLQAGSEAGASSGWICKPCDRGHVVPSLS